MDFTILIYVIIGAVVWRLSPFSSSHATGRTTSRKRR
jgi:hypothetical protein